MKFGKNMKTAGKNKTLILKNDLSEIQRLAKTIAKFGKKHHLSDRVIYHINLALEEVVTNIISYAYEDNNEHHIIVHIGLKDNQLILEVKDDGKLFNPLEVPTPDIDTPLEERQVGGLGIYLVHSSMDTLEYKREQGKNILAMKKNITNTPPMNS